VRITPSTIDDFRQQVAAANATKSRVDASDLAALIRIIEHTPEDMTVTVESGATLESLQTAVRKRGQWLPLDPPDSSITIQQLLAANASGPRRYGYGTVRDFVIGMTVVVADGRLIHSGGKVVKNVAGYDLMKLFIGDHGSLGIVVEVTFKLRPVPEAERVLQKSCESIDQAARVIRSVTESPLTPVVFDLNNAHGLKVVLGFDGTRDEVEWQSNRAVELGFAEAGTLDYDKQFHQQACRKLSVLPSKLGEAINALNKSPFVARAGNGVIYYRGAEVAWPKAPVPAQLQQRVKDTFDPNHIFPALPQ
jgi:glycolate oxidase FAD binding subunit